ncbi:unnamed protein product [Rodentolepis nana]|uniref:Secreted protein n=1 Tax=Rodentolepis nana TaxID=102285 RepID=A0A0R3TD83_RODNA|nr:unnamed protein product [Rodentolepis nana]
MRKFFKYLRDMKTMLWCHTLALLLVNEEPGDFYHWMVLVVKLARQDGNMGKNGEGGGTAFERKVNQTVVCYMEKYEPGRRGGDNFGVEGMMTAPGIRPRAVIRLYGGLSLLLKSPTTVARLPLSSTRARNLPTLLWRLSLLKRQSSSH